MTQFPMEETRTILLSVADKSEHSAVRAGHGIELTFFTGSRSVVVKVVDRCEGCAYDDVDFSPSAFDQLASQSEGRVAITWEWVS